MKYDKVRSSKRSRSVSWQLGGVTTWFREALRPSGSSFSQRTLILILLTVLLGGALACQVIWQHVRYTRTRVQLNTLERQNHRLESKIHQQQLVVARLERLDRIQRIAVNRLGMKPLKRVPVLELEQSQWVQSPRKGGEPMVP